LGEGCQRTGRGGRKKEEKKITGKRFIARGGNSESLTMETRHKGPGLVSKKKWDVRPKWKKGEGKKDEKNYFGRNRQHEMSNALPLARKGKCW